MKNSEEAHKVTEQIYRNLNEHFTPNLRQLSLSARNYYKALVGASSAAKTYKEALEKLGHDARTNCRGATQEIGDAIYQISEVYTEIQVQLEEQMKSLLNDLSFPLETKLETDFKHTGTSYKRYNQEHKALAVPFEKAQMTLNKIQKKKKSRMTNSEKEVKYAQTVSRAQMRLHDHRMAGLQKAMLDEWKSYCFLLECLCSGITLVSQHSNKTHCMIEEHIDDWRHLCSASDTLPNSSSEMFHLVATGADLVNYTNTIGNGQLQTGSAYMVPNKLYASHSKSLPDQIQHRFLRHSAAAAYPPRNLTSPMKIPTANVQAIYSHEAKTETQLNFQEGDILVLIGEKSDGWHYGYNTNDGRYGWFPLSFTSPINSSGFHNHPASQPLGHKVKSLGNLLESQDVQQWSRKLGERRSSLADGNLSHSKVSEQLSSQNTKNAAATYVSAASFSMSPSLLGRTPSSNIPPAPPMVSSQTNHNTSAYSTGNVPIYSTPAHMTSNLSSSLPANSSVFRTRISSSPPLPPPPLLFPPPAEDYADAEDISHQLKRLSTSERMNQM